MYMYTYYTYLSYGLRSTLYRFPCGKMKGFNWDELTMGYGQL